MTDLNSFRDVERRIGRGGDESGVTSCVDVLRHTETMRKVCRFWPGEGGMDAWDVGEMDP
jgi:hypothetical protein